MKSEYFDGSFFEFDRFDHLTSVRWYDYARGLNVDQSVYFFDRVDNRRLRQNIVSMSLGTPVYMDEYYNYDGLYRLVSLDRGQLNGTFTGIAGTPTNEEDWTLDPLGNWPGYVTKTSGTTTLNQSRTVNKVNEITGITESVGSSWVTPAYDRNGNMTTIPKPAALTAGYTGTWDAWNRLVKLQDGANTVAEYAYDGQKWRTVSKNYSGGTLTETRHHFYSTNWQILEERLGTSTNPDRHFVWGARYIDDLLLRDRDTNADGTLDERSMPLTTATGTSPP